MADNEKEKNQPEEVHLATEDAPTFYANNVNVGTSPWDMRLQFEQLQDVTDSKIVYKKVVTVFLAPGQARALVRVLSENMAKYEAVWARFVVPDAPAQDEKASIDGKAAQT